MKRWIAAAAVILVLLALGLSGLASGHALLQSASPAPNSALPKAPNLVQLGFSENLDTGYSQIQVKNSTGARVDKQNVTFPSPRVMQVSLTPLANGSYAVAWKALSAIDGHLTSGSYVFTVGNAPPCPSCYITGTSNPPPSPFEVAARWGSELSLAVAGGGAGFLLIIWLPAVSSLELPARRSKSSPSFMAIPTRSAFVTLTATVGLLVSLLAQMVIFSETTQEALPTALGTSFGQGLLYRIIATGGGLLIVLSLWRATLVPKGARAARVVAATNGGRLRKRAFFRGVLQGFRRPPAAELRPIWYLSLGGLFYFLVAVAIFSLQSHAASTIPPFGAAMDFLHIACLSLWVGGLVHVTLAAMPKLARSTSPRAGAVAAEVAGNFSALATLMVGGMFLSGGYLALELVGSIDNLVGTLYGQLVLTKIALFVPLLVLGTYNHFRLRPSLAQTRDLEEDSTIHRRRFLRTTRAEAILGAGILVAAGLLTALTPVASSGVSHPPTYEAERTIGTVDIVLDITPYPSTPGNYTFTVFLWIANTAQSEPYNSATAVILTMTEISGGAAPVVANLTSIHGFHFESQALAFAVKGTWSIAMTVKRSDGPDINTTFVLEAS